MSVTDIVRTIAKNVRQTVSDTQELKEKAKDLPLNVLQTALTGVGQALMLSDRIRTGVKRLLSDEEKGPFPADQGEARPVAQVVVEEPEQKPARREPVIFAPRPSAPEQSRNGAAPTPAPAAEAAPAAPPAPAKPARAPRPAAAAKPAATSSAKPATSSAEPAAETTAGPTPAKPAAKASAEPVAPEAAPKPRAARKPKAAPGSPATPADAAPKPARKPRAAKPAGATPAAPAGGASATAGSTAAGTSPALSEPMPGYSELSMASLRARLRGKSAEQIRALLEYERENAARDDIVQMYTKRLAKLEAGEQA
ncbi:hypothetical protein [Sphaerisporangium sp. TRM90804]|uniref:hypothetical protein n=1 Tax=Sphaerisporangium sp. TRM90804 TaxID=3031113 RepID=UPI00244D3313|nr:hypothetical protein [Sphaerisporangium sp. TRM90804]MDH2428857.1 hypothetical protein [Sphaerisporangium sp. TRM90804]